MRDEHGVKITRWDAAVDPEGILPARERYARADALRAAHYVALGLAARKRNRDRKGEANESRSATAHDRAALAEERRLTGRLGGLIARSRHDPRDTTQAAVQASQARFLRLVDPDGLLDDHERRRRANAAREAFYARLALRSLDARHRRAAARGELSPTDKARFAASRRRLAGRVGAYTRLATNDPAESTERARMAWAAWFESRANLADDSHGPDREAALRAAKTEYFRSLAKRPRRGASRL